MKDSAYLIFNKNGLRRMMKGTSGPSWAQTRKRPALAAGEYAVLVTVNVPNAIFADRPMPEAIITVPESAVLTPRVDVTVEMDAGALEAKETARG